ncbi:uncharacterized protein [Haliotis asinina]|uniref:uncharacterized protein n=1 Tax=Haliotis asinina TaxID=109174 RepID=UPI003532185E
MERCVSWLMLVMLQLFSTVNSAGDASYSTEMDFSGSGDMNDAFSAQYTFLNDLAKEIKHLEEKLAEKLEQKAEEGHNDAKNTKPFHGKAKGFSERKYVGSIPSSGKILTSGICASRQHPGIVYTVIGAPKDSDSSYDSNIYAYYASNASLVTKINLDVINVDWEDIACGPCDTSGLGHCIYISDTGYNRKRPANLIYKIQEPQEMLPGREQSLGEDEIEVIGFETDLENCRALMVSPRGRLFLMDALVKPGGFHEVVDGETKHLFDVAFPKESEYDAPCAGDISADGKEFILKFQEDVFYWYVENEEDMESVLTDSEQALVLPYFEESNGKSIAWSLDGASYFTVSAGENEPLFRYDRLSQT